MTPERIEELLDTCGPLWLGGQNALVRSAMVQAVKEAQRELPEGCLWAVTKGGRAICQPPRKEKSA